MIITMSTNVKVLSEDTIFAQDCFRFDQMQFQSCRVRATIVSCETNLRQSGGIGVNRMKKLRRVRGVSHDTICSHDSLRFHPPFPDEALPQIVLIFCILKAQSDWTRRLSMRPITDQLFKHIQLSLTQVLLFILA